MADFATTDDRLIAEVPKNQRETIHVALRTFQGNRGIDLRVHATNHDGKLVPTPKGVVIKPAKLRDVIEALQAAEKAAIGEGLLP